MGGGGVKDESWYNCDSVTDATVFLFVNVLNRNGIPDNKNYVFSWACVLYCSHSLLEKKKQTNWWIQQAINLLWHTVWYCLWWKRRPRDRESPYHAWNTCWRERKNYSTGASIPPPERVFPLSFQIRLTNKRLITATHNLSAPIPPYFQ